MKYDSVLILFNEEPYLVKILIQVGSWLITMRMI